MQNFFFLRGRSRKGLGRQFYFYSMEMGHNIFFYVFRLDCGGEHTFIKTMGKNLYGVVKPYTPPLPKFSVYRNDDLHTKPR